ncbi:MAG: hypothetical protein V8S08_08915 [Lachnoclostridium sp.]
MRQAIRNLSSSKPTPPRFCDVIIEGDDVQLEVKTDKYNTDDLLGRYAVPGERSN